MDKTFLLVGHICAESAKGNWANDPPTRDRETAKSGPTIHARSLCPGQDFTALSRQRGLIMYRPSWTKTYLLCQVKVDEFPLYVWVKMRRF